MPVMNFSIDTDEDLDEQLAEITKLLNYLLNGHLDSLNIRQLTADKITVGTLLANLVTIMAANGSKFFKLDENGIVANNGSVDTMKFDLATGLLTIVSALIQSATGYPRVELNNSTNLVGAYLTANDAIRIVPNFSGGSPAVYIYSGGSIVSILQDFGTSIGLITTGGLRDLQIGSGRTLFLTANNGIELEGTSLKINGSIGLNASINYVKDVVGGVNFYGTLAFKNGILTSYT